MEKMMKHMTALGFAERHAGTACIREAAAYAAAHPGAKVTKEIYPALARAAGTTPQAVERNIRHAVRSAWRDAPREWYDFCGPRRPTNSEVIARLVRFADED